MRKFLFATSLVLVLTFLTGNDPVWAYLKFNDTNACDQCHNGFNSYGSDTHQMHISAYSCNVCHVSNGDNPDVDTCAACHDPNLLWNFHLQFAGLDLNGFNCASCHAVTPSGENSWDALKAWYLAQGTRP